MQARNQQNFLFIKTFIEQAVELIQMQRISAREEAKFAAAYQIMGDLASAAENACLKLNLIYGARINVSEPAAENVFERAAAFYGNVISAANFLNSRPEMGTVKSLFKLDSPYFMEELGLAANLSLAEKDVTLREENEYWMRSALDAANATTDVKIRNSKERLFRQLERMNIAENVAEIFKSSGESLNEYMAGKVVGNIYDTAEELAEGKNKVNPNILVETLVKNVQEEFDIDDCDLSKQLLPWDEMAELINETQENQRAIRDQGKALRSVLITTDGSIKDQEIQRNIYQQKLGGLYDFSIPRGYGYLDGYKNDKRYQRVAVSTPCWKKYESDNTLMKDPILKNGMSVLVQGWINRLSDSMFMQGDNLKNLQNGDYEEDYDPKLKGSDVWQVTTDMQENLLNYMFNIAEAGEASEKFCNLVMNNSGVTREMLDDLKPGEKWGKNDYKMLELLHNSFTENYDEKKDMLVLVSGDNSEEFMSHLRKLPDSMLKYEAVKTLRAVFKQLREDDEELLHIEENGLADRLLEEHPQTVEQMDDFWQSGLEVYPGLRQLDTEEAADDLKYIVGLNFLAAVAIGDNPDDDAWMTTLQDIADLKNWDKLDAKSQGFVISLTKNYAKQAIKEVRSRAAQGLIDSEVNEAVASWQTVQQEFNQIDASMEAIEKLWKSIESLHQDYLDYKKEAQMFVVDDMEFVKMLAHGMSRN